MSMLIIGVNPPKSCYACSWYNKVDCPVNDGRYYYRAQRHPSCPLVEIPTPHGNLKDESDIISLIEAMFCEDKDGMECAIQCVKDVDTVIEAEGSE